MTATNKTTVYELPIFVPTDKPTWLGDFNGAMNSIEAGLVDAKNSSTTVIQTANSALNIANQAQTNVQSATTAANNAVALANTANTNATEAKTSANGAMTTANNANNKADNAISTANAASASATQALTTVNGINTDPPAIIGICRLTVAEADMPAASTPFTMSPIGSTVGMTWVSGSNGFRVDKAGVYDIDLNFVVKNTAYDGFANISRNRAGVFTDIQAAQCDSNPDHYMQYGISVKDRFAVGDIITARGSDAVFVGGINDPKALTLYITRVGA